MNISKTSSDALITFIRVPELGKVKTRLAADLGDRKALEIYCSLLDHTREVSLELHCWRYLYYASQPVNDDWSTEDFIKKLQKGEDLGKRIANAFEEVCNYHKKVIIIGSDCPQLTSPIIRKAFDKLSECDVVVGPTFDGGYYLLGMNSFYSFLFHGISWSTEAVFTQTIKKISDNNLSYYQLEKLSDVDYAEDWQKYGWPL